MNASLTGARWPSRVGRSAVRLALSLLAGIGAVVVAAPAFAQPAITLSVLSDYRLRGYTFSQGRPIATLSVNYDHPSGLYAGVSATGVLAHSGKPRFLALQESVGFAKRLKSGLTFDAGVTNADFSHYAFELHTEGYTDFYIGLLGKNISSHVFFSPNYINSGVTSLYAEVNGVLIPTDRWRVNWHVGAQELSSGRFYRSRTQFDWRLSLTREFGTTQAQIAVSRGGRGLRYPYVSTYGRTAVVVAITQAF